MDAPSLRKLAIMIVAQVYAMRGHNSPLVVEDEVLRILERELPLIPNLPAPESDNTDKK
jgi:hypothetical protein